MSCFYTYLPISECSEKCCEEYDESTGNIYKIDHLMTFVEYFLSEGEIESYWGRMRRSGMQFLRSFFGEMVVNGEYNFEVLEEKRLAQFVFGRFIIASLDEQVELWNAHTIRKQKDTHGLDGKPQHLHENPELYGALECGTPVDESFYDVANKSFQLIDLSDPFGVTTSVPQLNPLLVENGLYPITMENMNLFLRNKIYE